MRCGGHQDQTAVLQAHGQRGRFVLERLRQRLRELARLLLDQADQQRQQVHPRAVDVDAEPEVEPAATLGGLDVDVPVADGGDVEAEIGVDLDAPSVRAQVRQALAHEAQPGAVVDLLEAEAREVVQVQALPEAEPLQHLDGRALGAHVALALQQHAVLDALQVLRAVARVHHDAAVVEPQHRRVGPLRFASHRPVARAVLLGQVDAVQEQARRRWLGLHGAAFRAFGQRQAQLLDAGLEGLLQRVGRRHRHRRRHRQQARLLIAEPGLQRTAVAGLGVQVPGRCHRQQQQARAVRLQLHVQLSVLPQPPEQLRGQRAGVVQHAGIRTLVIGTTAADDRVHHVGAGVLVEPCLPVAIAIAGATSLVAALHQGQNALILPRHEARGGLPEDVELLRLTPAALHQAAHLDGAEQGRADPVTGMSIDQIQQVVARLGRRGGGVGKSLDATQPAPQFHR